jgi:hypothetical protein
MRYRGQGGMCSARAASMRRLARHAFTLFFVAAGVNHFVRAQELF